MKNNRLIIASGKGGVGKSTLSALLALAEARRGSRVLLVDCDLGNRCLDIIFRAESSFTFDLGDVIEDRASPKDATVTPTVSPNISLLMPPSPGGGALTSDRLKYGIERVIEELSPDLVIFDTGAGVDIPLMLADTVADSAIIVASQSPMSVRAADNLGGLLNERGISDVRLVIQSFRRRESERGSLDGVNLMIDKTKTQLIGILPYSPDVAAHGIYLDSSLPEGSPLFRAACNIAERRSGRNVPLFSSINRSGKYRRAY